MKAEVKLITPQLAKELLSRNTENRKVSENNLRRIAHQMNEGLWVENGESIIIDDKGVLKNGQHRLLAVVKTGYSYKAVIVTGVKISVMATIDTGANRSLTNVLELNGFRNSGLMASIIKKIARHENGTLAISNGGTFLLSNQEGLKYAKENTSYLYGLCRDSKRLYSNDFHVLSAANIGVLIHILSKGGGLDADINEFLSGVAGKEVNSNSASYYAFNKLRQAKEQKIGLDKTYITNLILKCWNIFTTSDMPIKRMNVDIKEQARLI